MARNTELRSPEPRKLPTPNPLDAINAVILSQSSPAAVQAVVQEAQVQARAREREILNEQQVQAQKDLQAAAQASAVEAAAVERRFRRGERAEDRKARAAEFAATTKLSERKIALMEFNQFNTVLERTLKQSTAFFGELNRKGAGVAGFKPISAKDLLAPLGGKLEEVQIANIQNDPKLTEAQKFDAVKKIVELNVGVRTAALAGITGESPDRINSEIARFILGKFKVPVRFQQDLVDALSAIIPEEREVAELVIAGRFDAMTPKQRTDFTTKTVTDLTKAVLSNDVWSKAEQLLYGNIWNEMRGDTEVSIEALNKMVIDTAQLVAVEAGLDETQRGELISNMHAAIAQMAAADELGGPPALDAIRVPRERDPAVFNINAEIRELRLQLSKANTLLSSSFDLEQRTRAAERVTKLEAEIERLKAERTRLRTQTPAEKVTRARRRGISADVIGERGRALRGALPDINKARQALSRQTIRGQIAEQKRHIRFLRERGASTRVPEAEAELQRLEATLESLQ